MAGDFIESELTIEVRDLLGMDRQVVESKLPPSLARLMQNARRKDLAVRRRAGSVILLSAAQPTYGALQFDGTNNRRVEFPDHADYDLGTKWALIVMAKTTGTPGGTQYLASRDVTPTHAGKKTMALSINNQRRLGFEMNDSAGTSFPLAAAAASVVGSAVAWTAVIYRDGATLAMHLDGSPAAALSRTDLDATLSNIAGVEKFIVGLNSNDNAVANFTGLFDGSIAFVGLMRDFVDVPTILQWTTMEKCPDPRDPRWILYAPFSYDAETGTVAKDWSLNANTGALKPAGLEPTRVTGFFQTPMPVQVLSTFETSGGAIYNVVMLGGAVYCVPVVGVS